MDNMKVGKVLFGLGAAIITTMGIVAAVYHGRLFVPVSSHMPLLTRVANVFQDMGSTIALTGGVAGGVVITSIGSKKIDEAKVFN